jgi:hypothetical protein
MDYVERNGYCFSDGVGVISPLLLEEVLAVLPFAPRTGAPVSAIQVCSPDGMHMVQVDEPECVGPHARVSHPFLLRSGWLSGKCVTAEPQT